MEEDCPGYFFRGKPETECAKDVQHNHSQAGIPSA
ncbi:UNVERIFIED_CONTAM: hypothetical protein ABID98_004067 [Brevibacillus sp. OAP136]